MSDEPFTIPPVPMMTPEKARDIARAYQGLAEHLREIDAPARQIMLEERRWQWWLTYAITLTQTNGDDRKPA